MTLCSLTALGAAESADPFLWLEDVTGEKPLTWAREHNAVAQRELEASPDFKLIYERLRSIYDSKARIPVIAKRGPHVYNFWRDAQHVRGLWRRTSLAEYRKPEPAWETVLDLDALAAAEKENWVWKGSSFLRPTYDRALISLSRGGGDAVVVREFDVTTKAFVPDGFIVPEAKSDVTWRDRDHVFVGTDFGPGSLTSSGYPRLVKAWTRGTPLAAAKTIFEGEPADVAAGTWKAADAEFPYEFIRRDITFFTAVHYRADGEKLTQLDLPIDAKQSTFRDQILVELRTAWTTGGKTFPAGALLALPWNKFLAGQRDFAVLFEPSPRKSLDGYTTTRHDVIVNELDNVHSKLYVLTPRADGGWSRAPLATPALGYVTAHAVEPESDDYFLDVTDFLTPTSLVFGTIGKNEREPLKQLPAFFDAAGLEIAQREAVSKDGTRVPYFLVGPKGLKLDGSNPTLLYGYGGFEISETPGYKSGVGAAWRRLRRREHSRRRRVRPRVAPGGAEGKTPDGLRRFHRSCGGPDRAQGDFAGAPRHPGREQRRPPDGRDANAASGSVGCGRLPGAVARHAALQSAPRRRELDGRVWQPGHPGRVGLHQPLFAVSEREGGHALPAGAFHDLDSR